MTESSISFQSITNKLIEHKVPIGATGITLGVIVAVIASLALAIIINNSPQFLGPINALGSMSFYGVVGGYALTTLMIISSIILLSQKRRSSGQEYEYQQSPQTSAFRDYVNRILGKLKSCCLPPKKDHSTFLIEN